ncbi:peptidase S8 [Romboutsia weinsteinii]|uniref:Peptidase S8 n=1 Tax=Romboutsia weinsteinii TaxID=2020949 RepID=A0A371J3Q5_9FIRM|nr:bile acid germinant receptor pseudoprotease CspC [Romboutsia weinsteinii]RDY27409.1 peptidase S8 [Romboutsia weinsteinii]
MELSYPITYIGDIATALKDNGINNYIILNQTLALIYADKKFNENILDKIKQVTWWQEARPMSSMIEINRILEGGETVTNASGTNYIYDNPYISVSGEGIMIAIIDSGIDYLHPDFINDDNTSKIISIWDQSSSKGTPPEGMIFGSEITREEINKAIKEKDSTLSRDNTGTGTIAAGIASGNGRKNALYKGVATKSELVVVKLREYEGLFEEGKINYYNTDFLAGIKYVIDVYKKEKKFLVVNLSIAEKSRAYVLTNLLDTFEELKNPGVIVVSGAGNEGNTDIHYEGVFKDKKSPHDIVIEVGLQKLLDISIASNGPDKIGAAIISPSGEMSYHATYEPENDEYYGKFILEDSPYEMRYSYPWLLSGNEELLMRIINIKPGIWTLRLFPEVLISGEYDIYLPNQNLIPENTRFLDPNSFATITLYGATESVITVGAYNDKTRSMWIGSSKGPIKGRGVKPDIVAAGVDIISTFINQGYTTSTGTGVSSSLTCGVIALLMEYIYQQGPTMRKLLFTKVLKTYLMLGATQNEIYTYPNSSQGYGVLNLQNTMKAIASKI